MRSGMSPTITSSEVHRWAVEWLVQAELLKQRDARLCTAAVVWSIVLRAASRMVSVFAACQDLAEAPSSNAVFGALCEGLPKTLPVLERRLNESLTGHLSRGMRRRSWEVAIDWHLVPYYGQAHKSRNELYYGQPKLGTSRFHAYATACIVEYGRRYTLALTWVRRHESMVVALRRLLARIRDLGLKTRCLLLDRGFYSVPVIEFLQQEKLAFLMPVVFRGRKPKKGRPRTALQRIKSGKAGWHPFTLKRGKWQVELKVCLAYRTYHQRKTGKRRQQKLLYAAWRVNGAPQEVRERYRTRFGIESSYRQRRQARIYTCTRNPLLRLVFVAVSLMLRNLWVWLHEKYLKQGGGESLTLRLHLLRFKRLLDWINQAVVAELHDGSTPCVTEPC
jgi:hypothetical protein